MKGWKAVRMVAVLLAALAAMPASGQTYPSRPVKIVLPFGAGGVADVSSRIIADKLGERLGQRFLIENMPGAGGISAAKAVLGALRQSGVRIALDDFGTGYSSLYHLRNFKVDRLKIDRSFVESMGRDKDSAAIVRALVGLGAGLGLEVTAEGVDDECAPVNYLTAQFGNPVEIAATTSRVFLGVQIQCAQCHDHPSDSWKRQQFHEFAAFFAGMRSRQVEKGSGGQGRVFELIAQGKPRYTITHDGRITKE